MTKMKMVEVTKAGGGHFDDDTNVVVLINACNINICKPAFEDEVGKTKVVFNDGTTLNVIETPEELRILINS